MNWEKKSCIFNVDTSKEWSVDCAQGPTAEILNDNVWRIYYGSRNKDVQSSIGYFDVEAGKPENILTWLIPTWLRIITVCKALRLSIFSSMMMQKWLFVNTLNRCLAKRQIR